MYIDQINLNHIRVFECVFRTKSMTKAADELHITQSGVSQHIKALEDILEIKLFDRIKQRLVSTSEAKELYNRWSQSLYEIEKSLTDLKGAELTLSGTIRVGLPVEFANNIVLPLIARFSENHPLINFKIHYGLAPEMSEALLKGELDFAFLDSFTVDKQIKTQTVYNEILELVASQDYLNKKDMNNINKIFFESLNYVSYLEGGPILKMWFSHHLSESHMKLKIKSSSMNVKSIERLVKCNMGVGVLPQHQIKKIDREKYDIHIFKGKSSPLKNSISLAYIDGRTLSPTVQALMGYLISQLKEI